MKPITRPIHAVLDYTNVAKGLLLPKLLKFGDEPAAVTLFKVFGFSALASALTTRYEGGAVKTIPFNTHLKLDAACALLMLPMPWLLGFAGNARARNTTLAVALAELAVVALSQPDSPQTRADEDAQKDIAESNK